MYINGSRRKVLVASIMELFNTGYVSKSKRSDTYYVLELTI